MMIVRQHWTAAACLLMGCTTTPPQPVKPRPPLVVSFSSFSAVPVNRKSRIPWVRSREGSFRVSHPTLLFLFGNLQLLSVCGSDETVIPTFPNSEHSGCGDSRGRECRRVSSQFGVAKRQGVRSIFCDPRRELALTTGLPPGHAFFAAMTSTAHDFAVA